MTDQLYLCSRCGSPSVEYSPLVGGKASCRACSWEGTIDGLSSVPVQQSGLLGAEETFRSMYNDFRKFFGKNSTELVNLLAKWGFIGVVRDKDVMRAADPKQVVEYVNGMFLGAFKGMLAVREKEEKDRVNDG